MARRLPSLNAMRAFEAAGRHVCFNLAAAELNVSHAAISRHIRELEADLGTKLFHRTGRGVELTDDGEAFSQDLTPVFQSLAAAAQRFASPRGRTQLVISAEVPFAALWLVPRLGEFTTKHPDIDLVLDPSNRLVDFAKNEADFGIRYGPGTWRDVEAAKLIDSEITLVCSPALLKRHAIGSPADIARAPLLQEDTKQHWIDWLKAAGLNGIVTPKGPTLKGHLAIAAAEVGQGFALADQITAGDALVANRLVRPFEISVRHQGYYLVRGVASKETKAMAAFRSWLFAELKLSAIALAALNRKPSKANGTKPRKQFV
jgi:LysR family transcriptional regulator, glycine cleavage system transcriptional activator